MTQDARTLLKRDPCEDLVRAAGSLSATARSQLASGLDRLLHHLALRSGKRRFGVCASCSHLEEEPGQQQGTTRFECTHFGELLEGSELQQICVNFQPSGKSAVRRDRQKTGRP